MSTQKSKESTQKTGGSPYSRFTSNGRSLGITWADVNYLTVLDFLFTVGANGDAPLFGLTRAGGLSVTIYNQGTPAKIYSNDAADMEEKLGDISRTIKASLPPEVQDRLNLYIAALE